MKRFIQILAVVCALSASLFGADLTSYPKPRPQNVPASFRLYNGILPQAVPTSLSPVVTQFSGCASAQGGAALATGQTCGVYIDTIIISCPTGSAGTIIVQDQQSSPLPTVPTISVVANTVYMLTLNWAWQPGGFQIRQATGSGCVFSASWGVM